MDGYSYLGCSPYSSHWSATDLSGWVNETRETSDWNPAAEKQPLSTLLNASDINNKKQQGQSPLKNKPKRQSKKMQSYEKLCVTDFCGFKRPNLNGLWVTKTGGMLGIKNKRYLWSDGTSRYLAGRLKVLNESLLTSIDGQEKIIPFKYKLVGNHLLTSQPNGKIREFMRLSATRGYLRGYQQYPASGPVNTGLDYSSPAYDVGYGSY